MLKLILIPETSLVILFLGVSSVPAEQCNMEGSLSADTDWYVFEPRFTYMSNRIVKFQYNITYDHLEGSAEDHVIIFLINYMPPNPVLDDKGLTCTERVAKSNADSRRNLKFVLNLEDFWSGCERISSSKLTCIAGRTFSTQGNATFVTVASRCGASRVELDYYQIGFTGYEGECEGILSQGKTQTTPKMNNNILIVIIACVMNSTIILIVAIYLGCRRWRLHKIPQPSLSDTVALQSMSPSYLNS